VDKRQGLVIYEIDIDRERELPTAIRKLVLTGVRGAGDKVEGEHVVFRFEYALDDFDAVVAFEVPAQAAKLLR
jgi:hypothetical protein